MSEFKLIETHSVFNFFSIMLSEKKRKKKTQEQSLQDKHFYVQGHHFHCRVVLRSYWQTLTNIVIQLSKTVVKINLTHYKHISIFDYHVQIFPNLSSCKWHFKFALICISLNLHWEFTLEGTFFLDKYLHFLSCYKQIFKIS